MTSRLSCKIRKTINRYHKLASHIPNLSVYKEAMFSSFSFTHDCRFFAIAMALVGGYIVLSLPFSVVCIVRPRAVGLRFLLLILDLVRGVINSSLQHFSCYWVRFLLIGMESNSEVHVSFCRLQMAMGLSTGAGAAAADVVSLAHSGNSNANWLPICQQFGDFCQNSSGAVIGALIAAFLLMLTVVLAAMAIRRAWSLERVVLTIEFMPPSSLFVVHVFVLCNVCVRCPIFTCCGNGLRGVIIVFGVMYMEAIRNSNLVWKKSNLFSWRIWMIWAALPSIEIFQYLYP